MNFINAFIAPPVLESQSFTLTDAVTFAQRAFRQIALLHPQIPVAEFRELGRQVGADLEELFEEGQGTRERVYELVRRAELRLIFGASFECNSVADLANEPQIDTRNIFYFRTFQQTDAWSCGYWSILNGAAIKYCLANNQALTPYNMLQRICALGIDPDADVRTWPIHRFIVHEIRHQALRLREPGPDDIPMDDHLQILAQHPQIRLFDIHQNDASLFLLGNFFGREEGLHVLASQYNDRGLLGEVGPLVATNILMPRVFNYFDQNFVRANVPGALHFVCVLTRYKNQELTGDVAKDLESTSSSHYILISVVKLRNRNPIMIICDSFNWGIHAHRNHINFIYSRFVRPFYPQKK